VYCTKSCREKEPRVQDEIRRRRLQRVGVVGTHTQQEWAALCEQHGNRCACCGQAGVPLTRDHVKPIRFGGTDFIDNIQPLCRTCNAAKGSKHIDYRGEVPLVVANGPKRRVTMNEAAEILGVSTEAIRKRVQRGSIENEKGSDGRRYVWITVPDIDPDAGRPQPEPDALTSELRDRLHYVEGQLEAERQAHAEARRIIAGLVERIPALEAPQDSPPGGPGSPERGEAGEDRGGVPAEPQNTTSQPWWRRMLGR
jgi:5-methylcytosine-specific restriction endonuclease McrA